MGAAQATAEPGERGFYFFLSYARTPGPDREESDPDLWVTTFYHDLCAQVSRLAQRGSGFETGYLAGHRAAAEDWRAGIAAALGAAEVFVPLYSPGYARRSWPLGELAAFRGRIAAHGPDRVRRHVQPVLWVPLAPGIETPELDQALELGVNVPAYARNGLLAMCRLTIFRDDYAAILRRLAGRIVEVAERTPVGRSAVPVPIEVTTPPPDPASFVIGVIAPTVATLPPRHGPTGYGSSATAWHPYARPRPVAEYAAQVAQRLGLDTDTVDLLDRADPVLANAGIVLIDPWILAIPGGRNRLRTTVKSLPEWVVPFVLANENDPRHARRGETFLAEVVDLIGEQQQVVKCARDADRFIQLTPSVVTSARRRFLSMAPMFPPQPPPFPPGPRGLPRLGDFKN